MPKELSESLTSITNVCDQTVADSRLRSQKRTVSTKKGGAAFTRTPFVFGAGAPSPSSTGAAFSFAPPAATHAATSSWHTSFGSVAATKKKSRRKKLVKAVAKSLAKSIRSALCLTGPEKERLEREQVKAMAAATQAEADSHELEMHNVNPKEDMATLDAAIASFADYAIGDIPSASSRSTNGMSSNMQVQT